MSYIIKVVTPPHPPHGFVNEFVEYLRKFDRGDVHLVREQLAAETFATFGAAMAPARLVQAELPERVVSVVPLGEQA